MLNARQEFGPGGPGPRHSALAKRPEPRRLENGTIEILRTECECGVWNAKESMVEIMPLVVHITDSAFLTPQSVLI